MQAISNNKYMRCFWLLFPGLLIFIAWSSANSPVIENDVTNVKGVKFTGGSESNVEALKILDNSNVAAGYQHQYVLKDVQLSSYSFYEMEKPVRFRHYFIFQEGTKFHYLVYDEYQKTAGLVSISWLRSAVAGMSSNVRFGLKVACKAKAKCTGGCQNMYYEMTNAPAKPYFSNKSNCKIAGFRKIL